jgi:DNA-binding NtrC family response regulator
VGRFLRQLGHNVTEFKNAEGALDAYAKNDYPMVLSDIKMPGMSGIQLLKAIQSLPSGWRTDVVLFTGYGDMQSSIEALRIGAFDYLLKPVNAEELASITEKIAEHQYLRRNNKRLKEYLDEAVVSATCETHQELNRLKKMMLKSLGLGSIGIFCDDMKKIADLAVKYHADRSLPVLIEGETGTGKEVVARLIHSGNGDEGGPFVDINCATFNLNLFESELFGYDPGAFTGSLCKGQKGKLDMATGGTIFLDELEELPFGLQGKLLRVIQEKEFYRVGGLQKVKVDVRFICTTNVNLAKRVEEGHFRKDLFFRLNVGHIIIPPLRERTQDILPLAKIFLTDFAHQKKKRFRNISDAAADLMLSHQWPGNVRELRNTVEWAVSMHNDVELKPKHLEILEVVNGKKKGGFSGTAGDKEPIDWSHFVLPAHGLPFEDYCNNILLKALAMHRGNKVKTAEYLGISRQTLYTMLKRANEANEGEHPKEEDGNGVDSRKP